MGPPLNTKKCEFTTGAGKELASSIIYFRTKQQAAVIEGGFCSWLRNKCPTTNHSALLESTWFIVHRTSVISLGGGCCYSSWP